jgi:tRNA A-37 threonylcarbamoyl transferase component Bud32
MRAIHREKFPRRLDKSRDIKFVKDSLQSATARHAFDFGYIQDARQRIEATRSSEIDPMEPPTVSELEEALGEPVQNFHLFAKNWRNRIYQIELVSGHVALAKQVIVGTDEMLRYQYEQLQALARFQIPGLRVPRGLGILPQKRVYLMEFAQGKPISRLIWNQTSEGDLLPACELAGKIIAQLQIARTDKIAPMTVESLAPEFEEAPWHFSNREENIHQSVLESVAQLQVTMGLVYGDYTAENLLFSNNELFLVDPPGKLRQGAHLWDFAVFRSSMRRHLWNFTLRRPFDRRRAIITQSLAAFDRSYLGSLIERPREPALFALAARLFELQRTAVSMTLRKGKLDLARQQLPIARDKNLGDLLAARTTPILLEIEKRWLFRQLARELPQGGYHVTWPTQKDRSDLSAPR